MNVTRILSIILLACSLGLAYYLVKDVKTDIDEKELIASREDAVIERLKLIREAEIAFQKVHGSYTSDWNELANFIKTGEVPIIERKETVITLAYGADSSVVSYDTLGFVSAKDEIFKDIHNVTAANNGEFVKYLVKEGSEVNKGNSAYTLIQNGKKVTHDFKEKGKVTKVENVNAGTMVKKGDLLLTLTEAMFSSNVNLDQIGNVPGYEGVKFEIFTSKVDKGGSSLDVIEVKNPKPFDKTRSEGAESKNRKPLRFGSKTDVTTSGNWE